MSIIQNELLDALNDINDISDEIEIYLPILKTNAIVHSMKNIEELNLQNLQGSGYLFNKSLNKLLYEKTDFSISNNQYIKDTVSTFDGFLSLLTPIDKEVIVYGIIKASFDTLGDQQIRCPACDEIFTKEVGVDDIVQNDTFVNANWKENVPVYEWEQIIPDIKITSTKFITVTAGYIFENKLDEIINLNKTDPKHQKLLEEVGKLYTTEDVSISMIKRLKYTNLKYPILEKTSDGQEITKYTTKEFEINNITDIYTFIKKLPMNVRIKILREVGKQLNINEYELNFHTDIECPKCGNIIDFRIDSVIRSLLNLAMGLL